MATTGAVRAIGVVLFGVIIAVSCRGGAKGAEKKNDSARAGGGGAQAAAGDTVVFVGDSAESVDSAGITRPFFKLRAELGSGVIPPADLPNGSWYALGDVVLTGGAISGYPYILSGQTFILVRRNGALWEMGLLSGTTFQTREIFVSNASTGSTVGSQAKIVKVGSINPRTYVCYTCDKKACCPVNTLVSAPQAQTDVETVAVSWQ